MAATYEGWTLELEYIRCGKAQCKSCPHGPYWYGYRSAQGRTSKRYYGKKDPRTTAGGTFDAPKKDDPNFLPRGWERIFEKKTADAQLARAILGIGQAVLTRATLESAFKNQCLAWHPDRGGCARRMSAINCAYSYLKSLLK